ncbi:hypothetical protein LO762_20195 [Actinocorallia sp. API 0066]|uniref:hypothetical protein n=1 Tax=Actinocorallia sp. API 0066 TaxID=2896846 RepID=UPI001E3516E3|nr:hypothetical protein [Actinocorallia sp. API 0066]MCD0451499.1 hypothetical protein [Actinocorallia sp. API 0066]
MGEARRLRVAVVGGLLVAGAAGCGLGSGGDGAGADRVTVAPSGAPSGALEPPGVPSGSPHGGAPTEEPDKTGDAGESGPRPKPSKPPKPSTSAEAPKPSPSSGQPQPPTAPGSAANPHTPEQVCDSGGQGTGYKVQRKAAFPGGTVYQLYSAATQLNCAVALKTASVGAKTTVWATLARQSDGKSVTDRGAFSYYAGPVYLAAAGVCVRVSGGTPRGSATTPWSNCG